MPKRSFFPRFAFGGALYTLTEFAWRGCSHSSMFLLGGLCFCLIGLLSRTAWPKFWQLLCAVSLVTALEFFSGLLLNRVLKLGVWDYTGYFGNLLGQICPRYCLLWAPLCALALHLNRALDRLCQRQAARHRAAL